MEFDSTGNICLKIPISWYFTSYVEHMGILAVSKFSLNCHLNSQANTVAGKEHLQQREKSTFCQVICLYQYSLAVVVSLLLIHHRKEEPMQATQVNQCIRAGSWETTSQLKLQILLTSNCLVQITILISKKHSHILLKRQELLKVMQELYTHIENVQLL